VSLYCCEQTRRDEVGRHATLNGIDFLEVSPDQRSLVVHLLKSTPGFAESNVLIQGGERVPVIKVERVTHPAALRYRVWLDQYGDFSPYVFRLVRSASVPLPPPGFDPPLSQVEFSFKVGCKSEFDCRTTCTCAPDVHPALGIDYLAKDYASFRRLILDRITQLVPGWTERSAADLGVTLAELIAYVGDHLSYRQDAVATEAYLGTARLRTSLRRHALLVDYPMHDGCNARTWVHLALDDGVGSLTLPMAGTRFLTRIPGVGTTIAPDAATEDAALLARPTVFEPMHDVTLHDNLNRIAIHTWSDRHCCLPKGATNATLKGHLPQLGVGLDREPVALLFEEVKGPLTDDERDADPRHRQVVRLRSVRAFSPDNPAQPLTDPLTGEPITEISWAEEDALEFPLCVSSVTDSAHGRTDIDDVSVARGNLVLADHGYSIREPEPLGTVPASVLSFPPDLDADLCEERDVEKVPARYRPILARGPLTCAARLSDADDAVDPHKFDPRGSARSALESFLEHTRPEILQLDSTLDSATEPWTVRRNLLSCASDHRHFVVEVEHDGSGRLRFGDGVHARRPSAGSEFSIRYRIGNGLAGNIGADALSHVVTSVAGIAEVRNPVPARGGVDMEDAATVRRRAPRAFQKQERAVTREDYEEVAQKRGGLQRAAASLRWTGSWHTVFITVDRAGGRALTEEFEGQLRDRVDPFRMAGHDLEFNDPIHVSLEIGLHICVKPDYLRSDVRLGILEVLSNRDLPDGRRGLFHPDRLTFGQTVYLSPVLAAARQVAGVASVEARVFRRQGQRDPLPLIDGFMRLSRLEVPRLDNDPNFPERGLLLLQMLGGR
jgi:baseplate J-like protein